MAGVITWNPWLVAVILMLPPLLVPVAVAGCATAGNRLAAMQFAGTLTALMIAMMTFAFDQSSFIDLALALALLSVPGTYLYALFLERWL